MTELEPIDHRKATTTRNHLRTLAEGLDALGKSIADPALKAEAERLAEFARIPDRVSRRESTTGQFLELARQSCTSAEEIAFKMGRSIAWVNRQISDLQTELPKEYMRHATVRAALLHVKMLVMDRALDLKRDVPPPSPEDEFEAFFIDTEIVSCPQ